MSLINDALQRAKTVQQIHPPAVADLPLRPIEPAQQQTRGLGPAGQSWHSGIGPTRT